MKYVPRQLTVRLQALVGHFPALALVGARQVGKTTLLRELFPDADYVVFDPTIDVERARQDPDLFLQNHPRRPLILDEIQYAPELVGAVKRMVDRNRVPGQFLLTGSQQWQVMRRLSESMAGRVAIVQMDGFGLEEWRHEPVPCTNWLERYLDDPAGFIAAGLGVEVPPAPVSLYEYLYRGSLPEAVAMPMPLLRDFHNSYLKTYVERDVRSMADLADQQQFGQFHRMLAALTAQEVNQAHLGREIGVAGKTAKSWLAILGETFQWVQTPPYGRNMVKRVSGRPKGYFCDTGLACAAQAISSPSALGSHPLLGALFETAVVGEVRKLVARMAAPPQLYHWRTHNGAEVDLLLERDNRLYPIEVKLTSNPSGHDVRGITALRCSGTGTHEVMPGLVVCGGESIRRLTAAGDAVLPWQWSGNSSPRTA